MLVISTHSVICVGRGLGREGKRGTDNSIATLEQGSQVGDDAGLAGYLKYSPSSPADSQVTRKIV